MFFGWTAFEVLLETTAVTAIPDTVTVNEQVLVFPHASVAIALTVVVPVGKKDPDALLVVISTKPELSEEVKEKETKLPQRFAALATEIFAGQLIVGATSSVTPTVVLHVEEQPFALVTINVST
jgi:hypothetical protein